VAHPSFLFGKFRGNVIRFRVLQVAGSRYHSRRLSILVIVPKRVQVFGFFIASLIVWETNVNVEIR
jgi:hypothetical protein